MEKKIFSIIIPTFNSESTLKQTLDSVAKQTLDKALLEVLLYDGGSNDKTVEIAQKYEFVSIYNNPDRLPEYAKLYGTRTAQGKYLIKMDSDEVFCSKKALENRFRAFEQFPDVPLLIADKMYTPHKKGMKNISSLYSTAVGDPFTFFMYRPKSSILETFKSNISKCSGDIYRLDFSSNDIRPIADGGTTTINLEMLRAENIVDFDSLSDISSMSDKIMNKYPCCLCILGDDVIHNNYISFGRFLEKLKFRIINNVYGSGDSGFSNRIISGSWKKYLFPIYSLSIIIPFIDSVLLSKKFHSLTFLLHPTYCVLTTFYICKYMLLKTFGKTVSNTKY